MNLNYNIISDIAALTRLRGKPRKGGTINYSYVYVLAKDFIEGKPDR